jgi:hypothetical protein
MGNENVVEIDPERPQKEQAGDQHERYDVSSLS